MLREEKRKRARLERAVLWFATVTMGFIVVDLMNREPVDWLIALAGGAIMGVCNFLFNLVRDFLRKRKQDRQKQQRNQEN